MTVTTEKHPEPRPLKDDGILIVFLGKDAPERKYFDFHYTDGSVVRYWVDVTAAAKVKMTRKKAVTAKPKAKE